MIGPRRIHHRRRLVCLAGVVLLAGLGIADGADAGLPSACKLRPEALHGPHPEHAVSPGCVPSTLDGIGGVVDGAEGLPDQVAGTAEEELDRVLPPERALPDLVPNVTEVVILRPIFWDEVNQTVGVRPPELAFDTHSQNLGPVPLDLLSDDLTNQAGTSVSQCVAWTTDFVCRERTQVGGFSWHDEHKHFHFNDFASYQFRRVLPDGTPDYSAAGLVGLSDKVSFCLIDSQQVREDAFPYPRYSRCDATNQGISPGWADIYGSSLPGQSFPVADVPDGRYVVIVDMNKAGHALESDATNNRIEVTVDFTTSPDSAQIVSVRRP